MPGEVGHWILVALENKEKAISILDSCKKTYDSEKLAETVRKWLNTVIERGDFADVYQN